MSGLRAGERYAQSANAPLGVADGQSRLNHSELKCLVVSEPASVSALTNLYTCEIAAEQFWSAFTVALRVTALCHDRPEDYLNLAMILQRLGQADPSIVFLKRALVVDPSRAVAWGYLAQTALRSPDGVDATVEAARRAVAISPLEPGAYLPLATAYFARGEIREGFRARRAVLALSPGDAEVHYGLLPLLHLDPDLTPACHLAFRRKVHRRFSHRADAVPHSNSREPDRRLKVGYLDHKMMRRTTHSTILLPIVEAHDPRAVSIHCYTDLDPSEMDAVSDRYRAVSTEMRCVGRLSDGDLARTIRADGIDVLIDVISHLTGSRLGVVARKPAPIQVAMLEMGSSGLASMDYAVGDWILAPEREEANFVEKILRVPVAYVFAPLIEMPSPRPRSPGGAIVFGGVNQLSKVNETVLALWAEVLRAVPGSRLLLKAPGFAGSQAATRVMRILAAHGVGSERLELRGWSATDAEHVATFDEIDIVLDCFPYPGITTTLEALSMGVPVVTMRGDRFAARYGNAIVTATGHPEWVASSREDYVRIAASLSSDRKRLDALRLGLRGELLSSRLSDAETFTRSLESGLRGAWQEWCAL